MRRIADCDVAVVGGAGFLGSHLVEHLIVDRGCEVLVLDNLVTGRLEFLHPKAHFVHCDITGSERRLFQLFQRCDYVFNYAAEPYIPVSFARPLHVFNTNAVGALQVINAAQEAGVTGILQVSSAEIYGEGRQDSKPLSEDTPTTPHSSYGAAKAAIDAMVQVRWKEAHTPCIALRQFNCVGERETHPYIVPEIISQLSQHTTNTAPVVRLGNNSYRDFLYAGDAVKLAVLLLERGSFGEVYNLGSETGIKMYDLAMLIGELMGFRNYRVEKDEERVRPWEIWHLQSDNSKLCKAFGTLGSPIPMVPLRTALQKTIAWFEKNGRKWPWMK